MYKIKDDFRNAVDVGFLKEAESLILRVYEEGGSCWYYHFIGNDGISLPDIIYTLGYDGPLNRALFLCLFNHDPSDSDMSYVTCAPLKEMIPDLVEICEEV